MLGISESYLGTLEREHAMIARRNERGKPVYTASDIAILRKMGVGKRPRQLRYASQVMGAGLYFFGNERSEGSPEDIKQARAAKHLEERELGRLRAIQEEARRQRAREWSEEAERQKAREWREEAEQRTREWRANKKESPEAAETAEKKLEGSEPRHATRETQEPAQVPESRPWWRRLIGG